MFQRRILSKTGWSFFLPILFLLIVVAPLFAGGPKPGCAGSLCGGPAQRVYWTDEQRAAVEGSWGWWWAMGEREREIYPRLNTALRGAGGWIQQKALYPAAGVAFGPWMERNFWKPLEQMPPDFSPGPWENPFAIGSIAAGKWGRSIARLRSKLPRGDPSRVVDVLIDQRALQLAKRKAQVAAGERTVTYWRVQKKGSRDIVVDPVTGAVNITPGWSRRHGRPAHYPQPLFVSRGGPEHAEHFARLRASQGLEVEVVSFEMPQWFDELVVEAAIPQGAARANPRFDPKVFVKVVDETKPGEAFEFGKWWRGWFNEVAVPGSGLIHEVQ